MNMSYCRFRNTLVRFTADCNFDKVYQVTKIGMTNDEANAFVEI
jgi:hypothetical protein